MCARYVLVVAALFAAVAGCSGQGDSSTVEPPEVEAEIESLITDFNDARVANDTARMSELTTDGFTIADRMHLLGGGEDMKDFTKESFLENIDNYGRQWILNEQGHPIVTGRGPWFASVVEHWENEALRQEIDGISAYVFVGEPGNLLIASKFWEGQQLTR